MGSDLSVVNAARVSFHKESDWVYPDEVVSDQGIGLAYIKQEGAIVKQLSNADQKLISYLSKHNHWSPFAHCFISFRIKAPIFVARQLVKHQVGLAWNEVSRRYVDEEPEFWFPKVWRGKPVNAKQGSDGVLDSSFQEHFNNEFKTSIQILLDDYTSAIKSGMAPEQARMVLPQNMVTEWIWSGSLMAFARVVKLRVDPHAQAETREVAEHIAGNLEVHFPVSYNALLSV
jgi:thymidylate synthase (FAD)